MFIANLFFVIGLELIDEFKNGALKSAKQSLLPTLSAFGGVIVPALIYLVFIYFGTDSDHLFKGFAIPTATDVAFSLAVLSFFAKKLNGGVRLFLMLLAVVDDIIGIVIIALAYNKGINPLWLFAAICGLGIWAFIVSKKKINWPFAITSALVVWVSVYFSGIHPTIAGVLLGVLVTAKKKDIKEDDWESIPPDKRVSRAVYWAQKISPISNYLVVPFFALTSLTVSGYELIHGLTHSVNSSVDYSENTSIMLFLASSVALIVGKPLGVLLFAWVGHHIVPHLRLFNGLKVRDLIGCAFLTGIGFTVSFLIADLSLDNSFEAAIARIGVLVGSIISAVLGSIFLKISLRKKGEYSERS